MKRTHHRALANARLALVVFVAGIPAACSLESTPADPVGAGQAGSGIGGAAGNGQGGRNGAAAGGDASSPGAGRGGRGGSGGAGATTTGGTGGDVGQAGETGDAGDPGAGGTANTGATGGAGGAGGTDNPGSGTGGDGGTGGAPTCTQCGNDCVDLQTNEEHCGACGYECVNGRECVEGRCTPAWQTIAVYGAPKPRSSHAAAFAAGKFIVFGGTLTWDGPALATGGAYDPVSDQWSDIAPMDTPRCLHRAVSTGNEIYTFGGLTTGGSASTVGPSLEQFVPDAGEGAWKIISASGAPAPRYNLNMVWTGTAILVFGGSDDTLPSRATGGLYTPATSKWIDASCNLANCDRSAGALFMDGGLARFMGGSYNLDYPDWMGNGADATSGLSYDPVSHQWSTWPHPEGTSSTLNYASADDGRRLYFFSGGIVIIYDRQTGWLPSDTSPMPTRFCAGNAAYAWSGTEVIGWSGDCSPEASEVGGRYQPPAPP